jgi:hypothetical protein
VEKIFPAPPKSLFKIAPDLLTIAPSLQMLSLEYRKYKRLIFVGHSEGAVVVRRAMCIAFKRTSGKHKALRANLSLFAPAHLGFTPSGWIGACLQVGRIDAIAAPFLNYSTAFVEMKDKTFLAQVQSDTRAFLMQKPKLNALKAYVLFGNKDRVVCRAEYVDDIPVPPEPHQDHTSICKPKLSYPRPLDFALEPS